MLRGSVPSVSSRSVSHFARSPQVEIPRSMFKRTHGIKTTFDEGYLVPFYVDEMVPGDTFHCNAHLFLRMTSPLKYPLYDNMYFQSFFFAVPNRLLWQNWEAFCGATTTIPADPPVPFSTPLPQIVMPVGGALEQTLFDYFGVPTKVAGLSVSALWSRAYNFIWNEWFRDQNLQDSVTVDTGDGPDTYANYNLLQRGKRPDYFTSCLPWPQKGPAVSLPLGTTAPIEAIYEGVGPSNPGQIVRLLSGAPSVTSSGYVTNGVGVLENVGATPVFIDVSTSHEVDLSTATAATINALRLAFQTQKLYEKDARGGTRYTEMIRCHFGVTSPDMRLQRPEYIGGGNSPVQVIPIAQTTPSTAGSNSLASLAAYVVCAPRGHGFLYSATEHMTIMGIGVVYADVNYQQGLERMWSRTNRFDFYYPSLAFIGEQAVLNQEIYAQGPAAVDPVTSVPFDTEVFGYQERFAEYRYKPSQITGLFRSNATGTLDAWHLAQNFTSLPTLGASFIVEEAPMSRVEAISDLPDFVLDGFIGLKTARPIPVYGVPGQVDRF